MEKTGNPLNLSRDYSMADQANERGSPRGMPGTCSGYNNPMTATITPELFQHLAQLAALELSPEEAEYLRQELNNQLKAIHDLEAIPIPPDTPVTSHGVPYTDETTPSSRLDEWRICLVASDILAQTPEHEGGYIIVPDIPHTDL